jgi:hypothetical protein
MDDDEFMMNIEKLNKFNKDLGNDKDLDDLINEDPELRELMGISKSNHDKKNKRKDSDSSII